jgi:hypothetical protein
LSSRVESIREPIETGERTTRYDIEMKQNGGWNAPPTDASETPIHGTVIGQRPKAPEMPQ